jgi:hypothetical protein
MMEKITTEKPLINNTMNRKETKQIITGFIIGWVVWILIVELFM